MLSGNATDITVEDGIARMLCMSAEAGDIRVNANSREHARIMYSHTKYLATHLMSLYILSRVILPMFCLLLTAAVRVGVVDVIVLLLT